MATFFSNTAELVFPSVDPDRPQSSYYSASSKFYLNNGSAVDFPAANPDRPASIYLNQGAKYFLTITSDVGPLPAIPADRSLAIYFSNKPKLYLAGVQAVNIDSIRSKIYSPTDKTDEVLLERYFTSRPVLIAPASGSRIRLADPLFIWRGVPNADFYEVHVAYDAAFLRRAARFIVYGTLYHGALDFGSRFYWRVRAVSMDEGVTASEFSDSWFMDVADLNPDRMSSHITDGVGRMLNQFQGAT